MKGKIGYAEHVKRYYVSWYHGQHQKTYKIYHYKGEKLYDRRMAEKLLACMQADVEKGVFRIEQYTKTPSGSVEYMREWVEIVKPTLAPATYKDYLNSIEKHLVPFFINNPIQLHEIQYDMLVKLLNAIQRKGKGKQNVMYCLHACLKYAWRSGRIPAIPPFPDKKLYNIVEPSIEWIPEDRQRRIIEAIPMEHRPIFWWLKYHLRRPAEAMALHKEDFCNGVFQIKRGFSAKQIIDRTKTGEIHIIPMVSAFAEYVEVEQEKQKNNGIISPYFFVHPEGKKDGKHYTHKTMSDLWKVACVKAGETIKLYPGTKHSSCSQLINEYGYNIHEVQMATDHARLESVRKYAKVEVSARKALLEKKIVHLHQSWNESARKTEGKNK